MGRALIRTVLALAATAAILGPTAGVAAQPAPPPETAEPGLARFAPFAPMIGRTWRSVATGERGDEDVQRWDWAVGGHALRIVHAVNEGAYAGETLVFKDRDSGDFIFHYFTTGGFHSTGVIRPVGDGAFDIEETVHGAEGIERLRSTARLGADGVFRVRSSMEREGAWAEVGGFDYREDPAATVRMPVAQTAPIAAAPPEWWAAHRDFMSRDGGRWLTPNPDGEGNPEIPDAFGMEWHAVNGGTGMVGRLYGVEGGREAVEYWTFREFFDPGGRRVRVQQWGGQGVYGDGVSTSPAPGEMRLDQTFWLPDGRSWREGHVNRAAGDVYLTEAFDIDARGRWTSKDIREWRRAPADLAPHDR